MRSDYRMILIICFLLGLISVSYSATRDLVLGAVLFSILLQLRTRHRVRILLTCIVAILIVPVQNFFVELDHESPGELGGTGTTDAYSLHLVRSSTSLFTGTETWKARVLTDPSNRSSRITNVSVASPSFRVDVRSRGLFTKEVDYFPFTASTKPMSYDDWSSRYHYGFQYPGGQGIVISLPTENTMSISGLNYAYQGALWNADGLPHRWRDGLSWSAHDLRMPVRFSYVVGKVPLIGWLLKPFTIVDGLSDYVIFLLGLIPALVLKDDFQKLGRRNLADEQPSAPAIA